MLAELVPIAFGVVFVAILALGVWLVVRTMRRNRAHRDPGRSDDLARLAGERGWTYTPEQAGYLEHVTGYPFDRAGPETPVTDLVTGSHRAKRFACFQYAPPRALPPGEPVPLEANYLRAFMVPLPGSVPRMTLRAADGPRWTRRFTTDDADFDKAISVGTGDEPFALRVLTEPVRRWLRDNPPEADTGTGTVQLNGDTLAAWYEEKEVFDVRLVEPVLDYLCDLLERLPAETWSYTPDAPTS